MKLEEEILSALERSERDFCSGEELADAFCVSRAAIWKAIRRLEDKGIPIRAVSGCGYQLADSESLRTGAISSLLRHPSLQLRVEKEVSSTNLLLKQAAEQGAAEGSLLLAERQTAGRGRRGRSFFSPSHTGLYLSLLLRPCLPPEKCTRLTTMAAVAVCEAIEAVCALPAQIKWVNDILCHGKKVCGILTEAAMDLESGGLSYVVVGIGINVWEPEEGFPAELAPIAGALFPFSEKKEAGPLRNRLAADIINRFFDLYFHGSETDCLTAYQRRCFVPGHEITIHQGAAEQPATALAITPDYGLAVQLADGTRTVLTAGEISIRL